MHAEDVMAQKQRRRKRGLARLTGVQLGVRVLAVDVVVQVLGSAKRVAAVWTVVDGETMVHLPDVQVEEAGKMEVLFAVKAEKGGA